MQLLAPRGARSLCLLSFPDSEAAARAVEGRAPAIRGDGRGVGRTLADEGRAAIGKASLDILMVCRVGVGWRMVLTGCIASDWCMVGCTGIGCAVIGRSAGSCAAEGHIDHATPGVALDAFMADCGREWRV